MASSDIAGPVGRRGARDTALAVVLWASREAYVAGRAVCKPLPSPPVTCSLIGASCLRVTSEAVKLSRLRPGQLGVTPAKTTRIGMGNAVASPRPDAAPGATPPGAAGLALMACHGSLSSPESRLRTESPCLVRLKSRLHPAQLRRQAIRPPTVSPPSGEARALGSARPRRRRRTAWPGCRRRRTPTAGCRDQTAGR